MSIITYCDWHTTAIIAGAFVLLSFLSPSFLAQLRSSRILSKYPFVNRKWDAAAKEQFMQSGPSLLQEGVAVAQGGPFQINDMANPRLILPYKYIEEYKNHPDLDFGSFVSKEFYSTYPGFDGFGASATGNIFQDAVRAQLTQVLALTIQPMAKEMPNTIGMMFGKPDDWTEIVAQPIILRCVARLTTLIFLGKKFMNNEEWVRIAVMYTQDAFLAASALSAWPAPLRPIVHLFLPACRKIRDEVQFARKLITPEVERRLQELKDLEKPRRRVLDSVDWFVAAAKGRPFDYAAAEIALAMASMHTTTNTMLFALGDVLSHLEYVQPMRDEIVAVVRENKRLDKNALFKMSLLDSFLRESMRVHPHSIANMPRVAQKDIKFSDGIAVPKGTYIMMAPVPMLNTQLYGPNPEEFDGYRFMRKRLEPGSENKHQMVTTSPEMTTFGHGVHACPGRFFASNEIKLLLAYLLLHYDFKQLDENRPHTGLRLGLMNKPDPSLKLLYKSREPEFDLVQFCHE